MSSLAKYFTITNPLEKERIFQFVDERRIKCLYHFTDIENIENIQKYGLQESNSLTQRAIQSRNSGMREFLPDYGIFLSISGPNDYMRFHKRLSLGKSLVVLEIEGADSVKSILTQIPFIASPSNSWSQEVIKMWRVNPDYFRSITGLENQFRNIAIREKLVLDAHEPTDPQSEIILLGNIPNSYITRWHIPENLFDYAVQRFGDQDCFHKDYKLSQGTRYDLKKAREEKELRTWRTSWMDLKA